MYYTVLSGDTYIQGIPYGYIKPAWHNAISATTENAGRMLKSLANVLTDPTIQPSVGALYGWFKNLTVLDAVIQNLTARNLTVSNDDRNPTFTLRAHAFDADGNRLQYPIFDIVYNGQTIFSVSSQFGRTTMVNADVSGNFSSDGFATSKASDLPIYLTTGITSLSEYYDAGMWCNSIYNYFSVNGISPASTTSLSAAQRNALIAAGANADCTSAGDDVYSYNYSGTFKNSSFSSINILYSGNRSNTQAHGIILSGVLWITEEPIIWDGTPYDKEVTSYDSTITINGTTINVNAQYVYLGYELTSAYLTNLISSKNLPTGTELQIVSGSVMVNGTTLDPTQVTVYINISSSSLIINTTVFSAGSYYTSNAFSFSSAEVATSKDGIKTKHIVPYAGSTYEIGTSSNKFKRGYFDRLDADEVYGARFN